MMRASQPTRLRHLRVSQASNQNRQSIGVLLAVRTALVMSVACTSHIRVSGGG